jgi:hypothetical protein
VDEDRDRRLEPEELVAGGEGGWEVVLPVSTKGKEGVPPPSRHVLFRMGSTGTTFSCATLGYLQGQVQIGERVVQARRIDGDANGFVTDAHDQLWLDLDGNGRWDALSELFLYAPTITIGGKRYAPHSDRLGFDLSLEPVEGTGRIELVLRDIAEKPTALNVLLVERDGSAVGVRGLGEPFEVPIGEYRVGLVTLWLPDPAGHEDWGFLFSDTGVSSQVNWYKVEANATVAIDPIGDLEFQVAHGATTQRAGQAIYCRPTLTTEGGLLINTAQRGRPEWTAHEAVGARIQLFAASGDILDSATSGFA